MPLTMIKATLNYLRNLHREFRQTEQIYMVLVAVVVGLLGGLCPPLRMTTSPVGVTNPMFAHHDRNRQQRSSGAPCRPLGPERSRLA